MGEIALRRIQAGVEKTTPPATMPALTAVATLGTIPAASYYGAYTWYNAGGQTLPSPPTAAIPVTLGQSLSFATLPGGPPAGAAGAYYYVGLSITTMYYAGSGAGIAPFVVSALPVAGASPVPVNGAGFTRGVAVAATRKLYGTIEIQRGQAHRFAVEDRGTFVDKYRGNPKLVEATFKFDCDATFEDTHYMAETYLAGGVVPTQPGGAVTPTTLTGFQWLYIPDTNKDTITTRTFEAGAEDVAWRGQFATTDSADFTLALDDALRVSYTGFTADWQPQGVAGWVGYTAALTDRAVESVMGYQCKLFVGTSSALIGQASDLTLGRFISSTWSYHNQNKRKYFGDATNGVFTKLGRGRRQVTCNIVFEAFDTVQFQQWTSNTPIAVRISALGTIMPSSSVQKAMNFDFWGLWDTFQIGARDTNVTWQMTLQAVYTTVLPVAITSSVETALTIINNLDVAGSNL